MLCIPFLCIPNYDTFIIWSWEKEMTILCKASDWVLMTLHCAEIFTCFELVYLNFFTISSDNDISILILDFILICLYLIAVFVFYVCVFEVIDAKYLVRLGSYVDFIVFSVVNHAPELWINRCGAIISRVFFSLSLRFLGNFPDWKGSIVASSDHEFLIVIVLSDDARNRVRVIAAFGRFQHNWTADFQVPKS